MGIQEDRQRHLNQIQGTLLHTLLHTFQCWQAMRCKTQRQHVKQVSINFSGAFSYIDRLTQ
jgi:hypothetical protein